MRLAGAAADEFAQWNQLENTDGPEENRISLDPTSPRAAAVAGILFSVLLITSMVIISRALPADPHDAGAWLGGNWNTVVLLSTSYPSPASPFCG